MREEYCDGSMGAIVPFNPDKLIESLEKPDVKQVNVFNVQMLEIGQTIIVDNKAYKIIKSSKKDKRAKLKYLGVAKMKVS